MLHGSPTYKFVVVEEFGIVSSYNPRTVFGDIQTMVSVSTCSLPRYLALFRAEIITLLNFLLCGGNN